MSRLYGRAYGGERIKSYEPFNKGKRVTMVAAMGIEGIKAATFGQWHLDGDLFLEFINQCLVPCLEPGTIVLMDNLSSHKVAGVREAIEARGARLVYLPAYSPDLTPIELCWSKLKTFIRKKAVRTFTDLKKAVCEAFATIRGSDIQGWYEHCGYSID